MSRGRRLRRLYGGPVWTLPILLGCLAVTGYVADRVINGPMAIRIIVWFAAAAALHDFVLFPTYSLLDQAMSRLQARSRTGQVPVINYVRVPAALSSLALLIYLPTILGRGSGAFHAASGLGRIDVFARWLLLSLGFFVVSGLIYLSRMLLFRHSTKEHS